MKPLITVIFVLLYIINCDGQQLSCARLKRSSSVSLIIILILLAASPLAPYFSFPDHISAIFRLQPLCTLIIGVINFAPTSGLSAGAPVGLETPTFAPECLTPSRRRFESIIWVPVATVISQISCICGTSDPPCHPPPKKNLNFFMGKYKVIPNNEWT